MKNYLKLLAVVALFSSVIFFMGSSNGAAAGRGNGYTGAPSAGGGTEGKCSQCHNGGTFGEPLIDYVISETAGGPAISEYTPGTTYFVSVNVSAMGSPAGYGFQSVFLSEPSPGAILVQAGTPAANSTDGVGARVTTVNGRIYAEHETVSVSGDFDFTWTAPAEGTDTVQIWTVGNAVNRNFGTSGDNGSNIPNTIFLPEAVALPLDLLSFSGEADKGHIVLEWSSANEEDFSHFVVERAGAALDWTPIADLSGGGTTAGRTAYSHLDETPLPGRNQYRLRIVDLDGGNRLSDVVVVENPSTHLTIFPNPTRDFINLPATETLTPIRIVNGSGKVVHTGRYSAAIDVRHYPAGMYYVQTGSGSDLNVSRFMKR